MARCVAEIPSVKNLTELAAGCLKIAIPAPRGIQAAQGQMRRTPGLQTFIFNLQLAILQDPAYSAPTSLPAAMLKPLLNPPVIVFHPVLMRRQGFVGCRHEHKSTNGMQSMSEENTGQMRRYALQVRSKAA